MALSPVSDNNHPYICRYLNNLEHRIGALKVTPRANFWTRGQNLSDLVPVGKVHNLLGNIIPLENPGLDVKIAGKIQVLFHHLSGLSRIQ